MPYGRRYKSGTAYKSTRSYARRKTSRKAPRTRSYRRKRYTKISALRAKWVNPLSNKALLRFTYCDSSFSRTLNVAGGYAAYYIFRGNSIYDPDQTGVGVQPYGFDQYVADGLYTNFRVTSSAISVYFRPEETYAKMRRLHAMIIPLRSAPVLTDISDVRMIPNHKETTYDGETESTKGAKMKHYMSTKRIIPEVTSGDLALSGTYAGNPTTVWLWLVYFYTDTYDDEEIDIYFDVKIKYYTILSRTGVPNES